MKLTVVRVAASAAFTVAMLGLGAAQTPQTSAAAGQTPQAGMEREVTATGCLMQASDVATLSTMPGGADVPATDFVLTRANMGNNPGATGATGAGGAAGAAGAAGATGAAPSMSTGFGRVLHITGMDAAKLKPHVGHQVEITGHMMGRGAGAGGASGTPGAPGAGAGAGGAQGQRGGGQGRGMGRVAELHATALKMVSNTCPQ